MARAGRNGSLRGLIIAAGVAVNLFVFGPALSSVIGSRPSERSENASQTDTVGAVSSLNITAKRIASALEVHNQYEQSSAAQRDAHSAATAAREGAFWAKLMFFAALAETVTTIIGVFLVYKTLGEARKSASEARRGADEAKRSADAAIDAYKLSSREFTSLHRPRLAVRLVETVGDSPNNVPWLVAITIVNVGETSAFVHRFTCDIVRRNTENLAWIDDPDISDPGLKAITVVEIKNGGHITEHKQSHNVFSHMDTQYVYLGEVELCVVGLIRYEDGDGVVRRTGFLLTFDRSTSRFLPQQEYGWTYED